MFDPVIIMFASSAYSMNFASLLIPGKSLMYMTNSKGPRILPWGTPCMIGFGDEFNYSSYPALWEAARAEERAAPNSSQVTPAFEDLAQFFDNLTRYVVRFIDARSEKIKI